MSTVQSVSGIQYMATQQFEAFEVDLRSLVIAKYFENYPKRWESLVAAYGRNVSMRIDIVYEDR